MTFQWIDVVIIDFWQFRQVNWRHFEIGYILNYEPEIDFQANIFFRYFSPLWHGLKGKRLIHMGAHAFKLLHSFNDAVGMNTCVSLTSTGCSIKWCIFKACGCCDGMIRKLHPKTHNSWPKLSIDFFLGTFFSSFFQVFYNFCSITPRIESLIFLALFLQLR